MKPKSQLEKRMDGMDDYGGGTGGSLVVIRNSGLPEYLKSYTLIKPKTVDKAVICDVRNPITVSGITMYENGSTAPNGVVIGSMRKTDPSELPDVPYYLDVDFSPSSVYADNRANLNIELRGFSVRLESELSGGRANYTIDFKSYIKETGEAVEKGIFYGTTELGYVGVAFAYETIHGPGTEYSSANENKYISEFGYVEARPYFKRKVTIKNTVYYYFEASTSIPIPFASIEEYNAAMVFATASQNMAELEKVQ